MDRYRSLTATAAAMLLLGLGSSLARAQSNDTTGDVQPGGLQLRAPLDSSKPPPLALTQAIDTPPSEHVLGTWSGAHPWLVSHGINLTLDAISEFAGNVSGGTRRGATFANQIGVQGDVNWERLAGITGLSTHVTLVNRSGSSVSHVFGDNFLPAQEIYGSGGNVAVHLVSAYAQETLFDKRLDFAAGRMNVENDFASSSLYCTFITNGLCGDPKALPGGDIGHSAFPDGVWAGRVRVRPTADTSITVGAYEVTQGLYSNKYYRTGFEFIGGADSGVYVPVQLAWEPKLGAAGLPGHYVVGFGYDTSGGHQDFGNALASASVPGFSAVSRTGNSQVWVLVDQMLLRHGQGDTSGLIALAGFVQNDPNNSAYAEQYYAGLIDQGFWKTRPKDSIGLLVNHNTVSGRLGHIQGIEQQLGLPYGNGATGRQTHETVLEATYNIHVSDGLEFQPDLQYILRPNAQANIRDALVLGAKTHIRF